MGRLAHSCCRHVEFRSMVTSKKHIRGPFTGLKLSLTIGVQALKVVAYQTPLDRVSRTLSLYRLQFR